MNVIHNNNHPIKNEIWVKASWKCVLVPSTNWDTVQIFAVSLFEEKYEYYFQSVFTHVSFHNIYIFFSILSAMFPLLLPLFGDIIPMGLDRGVNLIWKREIDICKFDQSSSSSVSVLEVETKLHRSKRNQMLTFFSFSLYFYVNRRFVFFEEEDLKLLIL